MAYIKYRIGHENSTIIENENYSVSIFSEQYRHALSSINTFLKYSVADNLQILAFCGERGSGKSSCMKSVLGILTENNDTKSDSAKEYLMSLGLKKTIDAKFEIPAIIDPSFFDKENNILELILGQIYGDLQIFEREHRMTDRLLCNKVYDAFSRIRECMLTIHGSQRHSFNDFSDLDVLSNSVRLKQEIEKLFTDYLKLIGKEKLIIAIDDIDLNAQGAYDMCEQIRKYLSNQQCIIFISFKYVQLHNVIQNAFKRDYDNKTFDTNDQNELKNMTDRYLDKLIPNSQRIHMPIAYDLCNRKLRILDGDHVVELPNGSDIVKNAVVNLIFQKTRFLFYNSKGGISPIVPNNLRDLFQLLGLVWNMPILPNDKKSDLRRQILESNKHDFKTYFFSYWTKCLDNRYLSKVKEWTLNTPDSTLNKAIVVWLSDEFQDVLNRNYDTEDNVVKGFISLLNSRGNFSYNVSVGDVFYVINLLEQDVLSPQQERVLFFIKGYYSIRLYENYDIITEVPGERYPEASEDEGIYRIDHRFDHTNELQRFVNGSYFSFVPGEVLRNNKDQWSFDTRVIKGGDEYLTTLLNLCKDCVNSYDRMDLELRDISKADKTDNVVEEIDRLTSEMDRLRKAFRLTEFFILTISRSIIQKDIKSFKTGDETYRNYVIPYALQPYNAQMGYYVFNVFSPFYALVNPKYTYSRFNRIIDSKENPCDLFRFAINHDFTLLREMIGLTNDDDNASQEVWLNRLQSDSIIRNAEVLMAIFENAKSLRNTDKDSSGLGKITAFYKGIQDSKLSTHPTGGSNEDKPYRIKFAFLKPLIDFIDIDLKDDKTAELFYKIFDNVEKTVTEEKNKNKNAQKRQDNINSKTPIKPAKLSQIEQIKLTDILTKHIGNDAFTASEIWDRLRIIYSPLKSADDTVLQNFVGRKKGDKPYTMSQLTDYILKSEDRYHLWRTMLNELFENELPF